MAKIILYKSINILQKEFTRNKNFNLRQIFGYIKLFNLLL